MDRPMAKSQPVHFAPGLSTNDFVALVANIKDFLAH
jgi:hypothetical protein